MKKLSYLIFSIILLYSCTKEKEDNGPTYCWQCIDEYGNNVNIIRGKTEKWAQDNIDKVRVDFSWRDSSAVCHELNITNCR